MGSDLRKEKKLPGFFDREIYNLLDGGRYAVIAYPLRSVKEDPTEMNENKQNNHESVLGNKMLVINEVSDGNSRREASSTHVANPARTRENNPSNGELVSREGKKRKCTSSSEYEEIGLKQLLIEVLEMNFTMMNEQLGAQNLNTQLDREQKKDHNVDLNCALSKIVDVLGRIADKL